MNLFVLKDDETEPLKKWFNWIHDENHRGERARLRRCTTLDEILLQPGFFRLCLPLPRLEKHLLEALAMIAGLLVLVETTVDSSLPELLGKGADKPVFSELRFQRLLASGNPEDFFKAMHRAIIQGGKKANPILLADEILHWYQQYRHPGWYQGQRQWHYRFAKPYYTQI